MIMKNKSTQTFFTLEQQKVLLELNLVVLQSENQNSIRTANAYFELLKIFYEVLKTAVTDKDKKAIRKEFEYSAFCEFSEALDGLAIACLNSAQYEVFFESLDEAVALGLTKEEDWLQDCAECFVGLGRTKEAEELVANYSLTRPNEFWPYIILGDIFYYYQIQDEKKDFKKAEEWYYYAYDRGISKNNEEDWSVLLERLGSVCVDRLRQAAYDRLLNLFKTTEIGNWRLFAQWKEMVYRVGTENPLHQHITRLIGKSSENIKQANERLKILQDAYNLSPQKRLDDLSPFEMETKYPKGEFELKFREEMFSKFIETHKVDKNSKKNVDARFFQEFSDFQVDFMNGKDPATGKKRFVLIEKERQKTKKLADSDRLFWTGFEFFRHRDYLSEDFEVCP